MNPKAFKVVHDRGGNAWLVVEAQGEFAFTVGDLPPVFVRAPQPLDEMSDSDLIELIRAEMDPQ